MLSPGQFSGVTDAVFLQALTVSGNSHPTSIHWDGDVLSKSGMGWEPGGGSLPQLHMWAEARRRVG